MARIWCPQPSTNVPSPTCYLHHIPIDPLKKDIERAAPTFLRAANCLPQNVTIYSYLIESLQIPSQPGEPRILYEANPTFYQVLAPAINHEYVCLSSASMNESQVSALSSWLLHFLARPLEEEDFDQICDHYTALQAHPGFQPYCPPPAPVTNRPRPRKSLA